MVEHKQANMEEIWKPIELSNGDYEVSNYGRVRSTHRVIKKPNQNQTYTRVSKILSPAKRQGYLINAICIDFKLRSFLVHRLVAQAFVLNPNNYPQVNHIDGDKSNNRPENLEWCTHRQNLDHAVLNGLVARNSGEKNGNHKLTKEIVEQIRKDYKPFEFGLLKTARKYGTSKKNVLDIIKGNIWK